MIGLGCAIGEIAVRTVLGASGAPASPVTLPSTPAARWHPQFSSVTTSGGRVTAASDLQGLAAVSEGAVGAGPLAMTDALGRAFWRFNGSEYLNVANGLVADQRAISVFFVGRFHRAASSNVFGQGNVAAATTVNTLGATLNLSVSGGLAPNLRGTNISATTDAAAKPKIVAGSQMQVAGVVSRTTANGGQRLYLNNDVAAVAQSGGSATAIVGGEIGRYPFSAGSAGTWGMFDLYEMVVFTGTLTNSQADAVAAALVSGWSIPAVTDQLVLEGDSITQGVGDVPSGDSLGMQISAPGASFGVPAGWRVVNTGISGNQVTNLVTRRDATNSMATDLLSGRNVVAVLVGRNDLGTGGKTGQQTYDSIVALLNTAGTGWLQRGWEVRQGINIAVSSSLVTENANLRTLLRAAQFDTDTLTAAGQDHAGKLAIVDLPLVTVTGSGTIFDTQTDAGDALWYQGDFTHPSIAGTGKIAEAYAAAL